MGLNDINDADLDALSPPARPVPAPEPAESFIDQARREADAREAARFASLSDPNPFEQRAPPPEGAARTRRPPPRVALALGGPWEMYGRIGNLPQAAAGANLVSAWGAFDAARARIGACVDEGERAAARAVAVAAGDALYGHLEQAFVEVPADEQAAYLGAWWHARTAASADVWMERWEEGRRTPPAPALPTPAASTAIVPAPARMVEVERATPRTATRAARHTVAPASKVAPLATGRAARATPELNARIVALDKEKKYSYEEIGAIVGVSASTVCRRLKQLK